MAAKSKAVALSGSLGFSWNLVIRYQVYEFICRSLGVQARIAFGSERFVFLR